MQTDPIPQNVQNLTEDETELAIKALQTQQQALTDTASNTIINPQTHQELQSGISTLRADNTLPAQIISNIWETLIAQTESEQATTLKNTDTITLISLINKIVYTNSAYIKETYDSNSAALKQATKANDDTPTHFRTSDGVLHEINDPISLIEHPRDAPTLKPDQPFIKLEKHMRYNPDKPHDLGSAFETTGFTANEMYSQGEIKQSIEFETEQNALEKVKQLSEQLEFPLLNQTITTKKYNN